MTLSRRGFLAAAGTAAAGAALSACGDPGRSISVPAATSRPPVAARPTAAPTPRGARRPDSLPDPGRPAGTADPALPFEHVVVVMMENHSFDNYFGMLPVRGQPRADGFRFDAAGRPLTAISGRRVFRTTSDCQAHVSQTWNDTHRQINGGRMDGFVTGGDDSALGYHDQEDLPFYYSMASTFTLANRWFCSAPCQTYPNRRFLLAGTAYGDIVTDLATLKDPPPPNGTLTQRLDAAGLSWRNYYSDLPATGVVPADLFSNPLALRGISSFAKDARSGALPAVSFVDPAFGSNGDVGRNLSSLGLAQAVIRKGGPPSSEENPQDVHRGQQFVEGVVRAVFESPDWRKILLLWTYDEHGGWFDHVPPPRAVRPDAIAPNLLPTDVRGAYDMLGPRVPAVVVSAYARPNAVTDVIHDHTSVAATVATKWNLPAMTFRDATAATMVDFLDTSTVSFPEPPELAAAQVPSATTVCS